MIKEKNNGLRLVRMFGFLAFAFGLLVLISPAQADWHRHGHYRGWHRGPPPPYAYAPPVVYAPPAPAPGINLILPLHIR